jgi:hypothetical protein
MKSKLQKQPQFQIPESAADLKQVASLIYFILVAYLLYWVIRSGYIYLFDADEFMNLHMAYLVDHGWEPFTQYLSVYSPVINWL